MTHDASGYGLWTLVILNSALFLIFAFSFFKPQTGRDWRSPKKLKCARDSVPSLKPMRPARHASCRHGESIKSGRRIQRHVV